MTGSWALSKFFVVIVELNSFFIPYFVCLFVQVSVNGVQFNSLVEISRCDPLSHPGGDDEPYHFVLHEFLPFLLIVRGTGG